MSISSLTSDSSARVTSWIEGDYVFSVRRDTAGRPMFVRGTSQGRANLSVEFKYNGANGAFSGVSGGDVASPIIASLLRDAQAGGAVPVYKNIAGDLIDAAGNPISVGGGGGTAFTVALLPTATAADWQTANNTLANAGGGFIELKGGSGSTYKINSTVTINCGQGVGIIGNGAFIDATGVTTGAVFNLDATARSPDNSGFPAGINNASNNNYHQTRVYIGGFTLYGGTSRTNPADGFDINRITATSGWSPRPELRDLCIQGFGRAIRHRAGTYGVFGQRISAFNCGTGLSMEGGSDSGENSLFDHCFFFNSNLGIDFNTGTDDFAVTFRNLSIDYNVQQLKLTSGYGRAHFYECHFEHSDTSTAYPLDFTAGSGVGSNRANFRFDGGLFVHVNVTKNFPAYMGLGQNVRVILTGSPTLHSVAGAGWVAKAGGGAAGADLTMAAFARRVHSSAQFELNEGGTTGYQSANRGLSPILCDDPNYVLTGDPSFEQTSLVDGWCDTSTTPGSTIGTIATGTTDFVTGTRCLTVPLIGGSGTSRKLSLMVPVDKLRGRDFSWSFFSKLSGGAGSYFFDIYPVIARRTSATAFAVDLRGTAIQASAATMSGTDWVWKYLNSTASRLHAPEWATHIEFRFNMDSVSNAGGNLLIDEFWVTPY